MAVRVDHRRAARLPDPAAEQPRLWIWARRRLADGNGSRACRTKDPGPLERDGVVRHHPPVVRVQAAPGDDHLAAGHRQTRAVALNLGVEGERDAVAHYRRRRDVDWAARL